MLMLAGICSVRCRIITRNTRDMELEQLCLHWVHAYQCLRACDLDMGGSFKRKVNNAACYCGVQKVRGSVE